MRKTVFAVLLLLAACASTAPEWVDTSAGKAVRIVTPSPPRTPKTNPDYPEALRLERIQGLVHLEVVVDEHGKVVAVDSIEGTRSEFVDSVLALSKTWTFTPHVVDGKPVKAVYPMTFRFKLD